MDEFSYLSVLLSIIIGLAVAQILTGLRGRMLSRARIRSFWPVDLWAGTILLISAQTWWAMFDLRGRHDWSFVVFLVLLLQTILLYLLAGLIYPDFPPAEEIDLRTHYFAQRRHIFSLAITTTLASIARDLVVSHALPHPLNLGFHLIFITCALLALLIAREWFHKVLAITLPALFIAYIAMLFVRLR